MCIKKNLMKKNQIEFLQRKIHSSIQVLPRKKSAKLKKINIAKHTIKSHT